MTFFDQEHTSNKHAKIGMNRYKFRVSRKKPEPRQIQFESSSHRVMSPFSSDYNRSFKFHTFPCHPRRRRMAASEYRPFHKAEIISRGVQVATERPECESAGAAAVTEARRTGIPPEPDGLAVIKQRLLKNSPKQTILKYEKNEL